MFNEPFKHEPMKIENIENVINNKNVPEIELIFKTHMDKNKMLLEKSKKKIDYIEPLLSFNNNPCLYPRSIFLLQGHKGCHKSRFAETLISPFIKIESNEFLGLVVNKNNTYFVIMVDTERNYEDQLPLAIQHIKKLAGYGISEDPDNFFVTTFVDVPREKRLNELKVIIKKLKEEAKDKHFVILIDVISDLIPNFNSVYDSLNLTDFLNEIISTFDCTVIGVIHQNPFVLREKARGHLGSELVNKSSAVLQIGMDDGNNFIKIKFLHLRAHKKPKEEFFLKYDEDQKILVKANDSEISSIRIEKDKEFENEINSILSDGKKLNQKELVEKLTPIVNLSKNSILSRIEDLLGKRIGGQIFDFKKEGRENFYFLSDCSNELLD